MLAGGAKHISLIPLFCSSSEVCWPSSVGVIWWRAVPVLWTQRLGGGGVCNLVLGIGELDDAQSSRLDALLLHGF